MKRYLLVLAFLLIGCVKPAILPKEPEFRSIKIYGQSNGTIAMDKENFLILLENIKSMQEYQKSLLKQLQEK